MLTFEAPKKTIFCTTTPVEQPKRGSPTVGKTINVQYHRSMVKGVNSKFDTHQTLHKQIPFLLHLGYLQVSSTDFFTYPMAKRTG